MSDEGAGLPAEVAAGGVERASARRDELLTLLLDHATDGLIVLGPTGELRVVTPAVERMLGVEPGSLDGTDGLDLIHPDDYQEAVDTLMRTISGLGYNRPVFFRARRGDGTWLPVELHSAAGRPFEGDGIVATVRDVSAWTLAQEELEGARSRRAVLASIAERFADVGNEEVDTAVGAALGELGALAEADRAYIIQFSAEDATMTTTHEWSKSAAHARINEDREVPVQDWSEWTSTLARGDDVVVGKVSELAGDWDQERYTLQSRGVTAVVAVPMMLGGRPLGFLGFELIGAEHDWSENAVALLRLAGNLIGSAIARNRAYVESRISEERFRTLVEHSSDLIIVVDKDGMFTTAPLGEDRFGYSPAELIGTNALELVHPDDVANVTEALAATSPGARTTLTLQIWHHDGHWVPVELVAVNQVLDPAIRGVVMNVRDITERLRVAAELRDSEERFRSLIANIPGAVYRCEVTPPYRDLFVSEAVAELTGYRAAEFLDDTVLFDELIVAEHRTRTDRELEDALRLHRPVMIEYPIRHRDGSERWISEHGQVAYGEDGVPRWLEGALFDITARKELEQQLAHDASHDPLTGLPNRTFLVETLNEALRAATRTSHTVAALFVDLDRFKRVNDAFGHSGGDELLVAFTKRISGVLRAFDVATRTGGDEFVVVCSQIASVREAVQVARRISATLREPFEINGREVFVSASIGIAIAGPTSTADALVRDADVAAYRAKDLGRDRIEVFDEALRAKTAAALETETALHRAVAEQQLLLRYQPVMDLSTERAVGFEGLLRWQHPTRGLLPPDAFLEAAEASGLIVPIGRQVVEMACAVLTTLPPGHDLTLAVNLSPRELAEPDLVTRVRRAMREAGIGPGRLCLEITESALLDDIDSAAQTLGHLRDAGALLAIDDFGTGYSSLSYLSRLPVDIVKIDRSFVADLGNGGRGDAIIAGIVGLAFGLGLEIVAEGIETVEQAQALIAMGCTRGQGYLYSEAVTLEQALAKGLGTSRGDDAPARH